MKKLSDVQIERMLREITDETVEDVDFEPFESLIEEVKQYRKGSLVARGYQINRLQNDLHKERQRNAELVRQRELLLDSFTGSVGDISNATRTRMDRDANYKETAKNLKEILARRREKAKV